VDAGRTLAAETVRRMQSSEAFRADVTKAREEVQAARARGIKPARDCAAEAAALAIR
jgi:acid phosphatase (class A)